ncbi:MAG TPA: methyl-accepting chemotaxis protein [Candidatus Baltobacteraceae bacterium]|nr:methyl-accepting chemotaxis protein [Candidatus Baltobacteraceae bacterium]
MAIQPSVPDGVSRFREAVRRAQRAQSRTGLASIPATVLIATIFGRFVGSELGWIVLGVAIVAGIALPGAHTLDRRFLRPVRKAIGDPSSHDAAPAISRARRLPLRIFTLYVSIYAIGSFLVAPFGNALAHQPLWLNLGAIFGAGVVGGIVDGTLNFFSAEVLSAQIVALICEARGMLPPVSQHARGGISRRLIASLMVVIGVTVVAMGGGSIHLLIGISEGAIKTGDALRLGMLYTVSALAVAVVFASLASSLLSKSIARPILRTVELMDRLREGDLLHANELYGEPVLAHEAGLLVSAFADANIGLGRLASSGERLASGDLSVQVRPNSERDIVAVAFSKVVEAIRTVVEDVATTVRLLEQSSGALSARAVEFSSDAGANARDLGTAADSMRTLDGEVASVTRTANDLSRMAEHSRETAERLGQAAQTNAAGLEELAQTAKATIEAAHDVIELSASTGHSADEANRAIAAAERTSDEAGRVMHDLVNAIESLRVSSQQIGSITEKIDEIADQTNLLALNAAIEAARAGEHGRGFAVVADEIRKLADSSAQATHEIATLIRAVQSETDRAVDVTRRGTDAVESGRQKTSQVTRALEEIITNIASMRMRIDAVVHAQREQKTATDSLVDSTHAVERLTADNADVAKSLASLAAELELSAHLGAQAVSSTAEGVKSVVARGERIAATSTELETLTKSLRAEAERIRAAVSGFRALSP